MAAGCKKADRNKKSAQNTRYIAERRRELNKKRNMARHAKRCISDHPLGKFMQVPRGTRRDERRVGKQEAYAAQLAAAA